MSIVTAMLAAALLSAPTAAAGDVRIDPPCSTLTVTIHSLAEVPSGMSVRALQEGLNYPELCQGQVTHRRADISRRLP